MALELNKLTNAIDALGDNTQKRLAELNEKLPVAQATLDAIAADPAELRQKANEVAHKFRWAGALPTDEPVNAVFPRPALPQRFNVIAADGSQIYPDRHGIALYYLVNIGSIVFRHGTAEAPQCDTRPELFFDEADLYEDEALISTVKINAERDTRELGELARLAGMESAAPTVTLLDNGLLFFFSLQEQDRKAKDEAVEKYLQQLDALRESGAAVAGVVDRPRAANVIRLLHLAKLLALGADTISQDTLRGVGDFKSFTDAMVFRLGPGERSALFVNASPDNLERYQTHKPHSHTIYFFYLNTGQAGHESILRIEVPEWVASDKDKLDLVHAAIVEQGRFGDGFPYTLIRAHELAVVTMDERRAFDELVTGSLVRRGFAPGLSAKAQGKAWTGSGKRHYGR